MSRYNTVTKRGNPVFYGYDHACGYFYQEFDKDDEDNCLVDQDSLFNGLTGVGLALMLEGIAPDKHISNAMMDLPI